MDFGSFAALAPEKKKGPSAASKIQIERSLAEADAMRTANNWSEAKGRHWVSLYVWCHKSVYGILPSELSGKEWTMAVMAAHRLCEREFNDSAETMLDFVRWAWARERKAHARAGDSDRRRFGWRLQFSASLATDYRLSVHRGNKK